MYPFVLSVSMNHGGYFTDLVFFAIYFQLLFVFINKKHFESFKKSFWTRSFGHRRPNFLLFCLRGGLKLRGYA